MRVTAKEKELYLKQFKKFWDKTSLIALEVEKIVVNNIMD